MFYEGDYMVNKIVMGRAFGMACCEHFGIKAKNVTGIEVASEVDEVFAVSITMPLSADDLAAIAVIMDSNRD